MIFSSKFLSWFETPPFRAVGAPYLGLKAEVSQGADLFDLHTSSKSKTLRPKGRRLSCLTRYCYPLGYALLCLLGANVALADTSIKVLALKAEDTFQPSTVPMSATAPLAITPPTDSLDASTNNTDLAFNFQDVSIKTLLQIIAKNSGINFIISDSVKGNMDLSLQKVSWQQALNVVLRANGLDSRQVDNVMIIAPIEELAANDIKRLTAKQQMANLTPPDSVIIHLHFANAIDLAAVIKGQDSSLLSTTGQIGVDPRTNVIWIRDNAENVTKVKQFIQQLDIPAKQILIEARIVSVDTAFAKNLGVRYISTSSNLTGASANTASTTAPAVALGLNFNAPSVGVFGATAGSYGLALGSVGGTDLDLELSALEGEQHGEVIANPRIVTSNLQTALIETGQEIPYQEATSSGATSVTFKKAVLSLQITPQITSNNNVVLKLKITQDKAGAPVITSTGSIPSIDTQEVDSYVQLKDRQTIVIGGVYQQTSNKTITRIPFLSDIPWLGALFQYKGLDSNRRELLIFITPTLVNSETIGQLSMDEHAKNQLGLSINKGVKAEPAYESSKF